MNQTGGNDAEENRCCKRRTEKGLEYGHPVPVLFIMTSNAPDTMYSDLVDGYKQVFDTFVGPTEVLVSGETLQLRDYSATDWPWTLFDPALKQERHEKVFPEECRKAYELGAGLVQR